MESIKHVVFLLKHVIFLNISYGMFVTDIFFFLGSMGLDKFGGTAWGEVRESAATWSKPKEIKEEDCVICYDPLAKDKITTLQCKHTFHTKVRICYDTL